MTSSEQRRNRASDWQPKPPAKWFYAGFQTFLKRFLRKNFHGVVLAKDSSLDVSLAAGRPIIIYVNHPSWWDPLIAHFLNQRLFPERDFFAPIDAEALAKYRVFARLGFFGVQLSSTSGTAQFLSRSAAVLERSNAALWLTPEGRFADSRDRTAELMPGLAHLCRKHDSPLVVPMAMEYAFWNERLPMCFAAFGKFIDCQQHPDWDKATWHQNLTTALRGTQQHLESLVIQRCDTNFQSVLQGDVGGGAVYDSFRRVKAMLTGKQFEGQHGEHFQ
ncbi:hypothetical protein SV7mr_15140 [Stieleria bergensis]|uniref:Phospholipid/glycerol acyltransferase domain-containing protein n=1 Tax=Stieleria bergensis TaxID=2528025 RepID=A0A517SSA7_9BACT|nr:hypothetical protein SV7mr_15140 [Planctomycetes bacterium SV_7m_r]